MELASYKDLNARLWASQLILLNLASISKKSRDNTALPTTVVFDDFVHGLHKPAVKICS